MSIKTGLFLSDFPLYHYSTPISGIKDHCRIMENLEKYQEKIRTN